MQKSEDSPPVILNDEELWRLEWSIFDYQPMRMGIYSSLETHMEDYSVLDNQDNTKLYNILILVYNIFQIGKSAPSEIKFNCNEGFSFLSQCFSSAATAIQDNKQVSEKGRLTVRGTNVWLESAR